MIAYNVALITLRTIICITIIYRIYDYMHIFFIKMVQFTAIILHSLKWVIGIQMIVWNGYNMHMHQELHSNNHRKLTKDTQ